MTDPSPTPPHSSAPRPTNLALRAAYGLAVLTLATGVGAAPTASAPARDVPATAAPRLNAAQSAVSTTITIPLASMRAAALAEFLRSVVPATTTLSATDQAVDLSVAAATEDDCARIERLVNALDRVGIDGELSTAPLAHVSAAVARETLEALLGKTGRLAKVAIADDPRGNGFILRGEPGRVALVARAVAAIDMATPASPPPAGAARARGESAVERIACASPVESIAAARMLLPARSSREVAVAAGPDGGSVLLAGDVADLDEWRLAIASFHAADARASTVRLVRLSATDAVRVVEQLRVQIADDAELRAAVRGLILELDAASRELALIGTVDEVDRALALLRRVEGGRAIERESAVLRVAGDSRQLASTLAAFASSVQPPRDREAARFDAFATLGAIAVSGEPGTIALAETLLACIDAPAQSARVARRIAVPIASSTALVERALAQTAERLGASAAEAAAVRAEVDASSGIARVSGTAASVELFESTLLELRGLRQPHRTARILPLRAIGTDAAAAEVSNLLGAPVPVDASRSVPAARVRELPSLRALFVAGEPAQIALLERIVAAREADPAGAAPAMRLLELRCSDAVAVARAIEQRFAARDESDRRARPVLVEGDAASGALSVAAHPALIAEVAAAVDTADPRGDAVAARPREVFSSTLAQSDALVVARALNGLFAKPAMPLDAFGHELPSLQEPRELQAIADPASRMVWVEAARERTVALDALVGLLDRLTLAPGSDVRLFRLEKGDITRVVQSLRDLAARGMLSKGAVAIDAEAMSRTLVVVGDAVAFEKTEQILRQLGMLAAESGVLVVDAAGGDPEQLRTRALKLAGLDARDGDASPIGTTVDAARGLVRAVGETSALTRFAEACRRLAYRAEDSIEASSRACAAADASRLGAAISELAAVDARVIAVAPLAAQDRLAVVGSRAEAERVDALLALLASGPTSARIESIPCADAAITAQAIDGFLAARSEPDRRARPARVRAGADGDSLVVCAHPDAVGEIARIVRDLEPRGGRAAVGRETRVEMLRSARADAIARLFRSSSRAVSADGSGARALVIEGTPVRCAMIAALASTLDESDGKTPLEVRAWRLPAASVASATEAILRAGATKVEPVAEGAFGGVLIAVHAGSARDAVDAAMRGVDSAATVVEMLRSIPLSTLASERAASMLGALLTGELAMGESGARARAVLGIDHDPSTNTMLVSGPGPLCALAEAFVTRLEGVEGVKGVEGLEGAPSLERVRLRPLVHADGARLVAQANAPAGALACAGPRAVLMRGDGGALRGLEDTVTALDDAAARLDDTAAKPDARPAPVNPEVRAIPLASLEGARFAPLLQGLLADAMASDPRSAAVPAGGASAPARVETDARGNALMVTGNAASLALAEELTRAYERDEALSAQSAAVFTPARADAATLASDARVIAAAAGRARVVALERSGVLLLVGATDDLAAVRGALVAIDSATFALPTIECAQLATKHVSAETAAEIVAEVLSDRARWPAALAAAARAGIAIAEPRVVADAAGSRVLVAAPPGLVSIAAEVVARLDAERERGERWEVRVYPIAGDLVEPALLAVRQAIVARTPAGSKPPRIELADIRDGGALVVSGEPSWLDAIDAIVRSIDVRGPREAARARVVSLRHGDAARLAPLVTPLVGQDAPDATAPATVGLPQVRALADARSNAIALVATPTALDVAEEVLRELDAAPGAAVERSMRLYELRAGDAAVVAKTILDLFETDDGGDQLPSIRVHASRNSLLVRASERQRTTIEGIIAKADAAATARARLVRVLAVDPARRRAAEAAELAARLSDPKADVRLAVDDAGNAVVVFGAEDEIARVASIVALAERAVGPIDPRVRMLELPASAEPRALVALARAALAALSGASGGPDAVAARAILAERADARAVACVGGDADVRLAVAVVDMLVRGQNVGSFALRSVALAHADAARVGGALEEQSSRADGTLRVVADDASHSLVLLGSPREVDAGARLAARLDRRGDARTDEVRLVPLRALRCADAAALVMLASPVDGATPVIAAEPVTNALVFRGDPSRLTSICELLARLDDPAAKDFAPFEAIRCTHIAPSAVAAAVESAIGGADSARRGRMRLVADDASRILFARAESTLLSEVRAAIAAADAPPAPPAPPPPASAPEGGPVVDPAPQR